MRNVCAARAAAVGFCEGVQSSISTSKNKLDLLLGRPPWEESLMDAERQATEVDGCPPFGELPPVAGFIPRARSRR